MSRLTAPSLLLAAALGSLSAGALAEKADRTKPMTLESDQPCTVSLLTQTSLCTGNVVVSQGTLQIRAERLEIRETPEGYQVAQASGGASRPAVYRQKRDGVDERVEGQAQRIDYDSRLGTLRFEGQAVVRRLRGSTVADEIQGALIIWDSQAESFTVQGGAGSAANPGGRVRAILSPRSAQAPLPTASNPAPGGLAPSTSLGERP